MKTVISLILLAGLTLCISSCKAPSSDVQQPDDTETVAAETESQTQSSQDDTSAETAQEYVVYKIYSDDLWDAELAMGHPWLEAIQDRTQSVGEEFEVSYTFVTENAFASEYEYAFSVSDPSVAEVIEFGRRNEILYGSEPCKVRLKGIKPGTVWLEMKMTQVETGGSACTYVPITIVASAK